MRRNRRPMPDRTAYAAAMREFEEYQQWRTRLRLNPNTDRQELAEVDQMCRRAERKVLKLEVSREVR